MAVNLPREISSYLPEKHLRSLAIQLNDTDEHIESVTKYGILAICWLILNRNEREGASILLNLAKHSLAAGFPEKIESHMAANLLSLPNANFAEDLSEGKISQLNVRISNFTRVKAVTVRAIMLILAPISLGILGKHAIVENWRESDLSAWLKDQQNEIFKSLPPGLNLNSLSNEGKPLIKNDIRQGQETHIVSRKKIDYTPTIVFVILIVALIIIFFCYKEWSINHGDPLHLKALF